MKFNKKQKIIWLAGAGLLMLIIVTVICLGNWLGKRRRNAEIIQQAITNPQTIKPGKFLNAVGTSFRNLPEKQKKSILKDPALTEKYVAEAICKELNKSFKMLFCLPAPIRKKIISTSAERLLNSARKNPGKVTATFNSAGGRGALNGASRFFLLYLSGKEKAEVAPLTAAMYKIVRQQSKGIKIKNVK
jgi:hypothetical protein